VWLLCFLGYSILIYCRPSSAIIFRPWFLRRAAKCMNVHIGFPSTTTTQTLRYQNAHSSGLAFEYIKYFSHVGRGSITKYTVSAPTAENSPPRCSIELSFPRLLYE
jgi:hypothetical protein